MKSIGVLIVVCLIGIYTSLQAQFKYPEAIESYIEKSSYDGLVDTVYLFPFRDTSVFIKENRIEIKQYHGADKIVQVSKLNPRIIVAGQELAYIDMRPATVFFDTGKGKIELPSRSNYLQTGDHKGRQHYIWDYHDKKFFTIALYSIYFNDRIGFLANSNIRQLSEEYMEKNLNSPERILLPGSYIPSSYSENGGIVMPSLMDRSTDMSTLHYINEPVFDHPIDTLDKYLWVDFHIDREGRVHGFWTYYDEIVHTVWTEELYSIDKAYSRFDTSEEKKSRLGYFKEVNAGKTGLLSAPFTSITLGGTQYLFLQDGQIFRSAGNGMEPAGRLPGTLWELSVVWDKEADRAWTMTIDQYERYKAGDTSVVKQMKPLTIK